MLVDLQVSNPTLCDVEFHETKILMSWQDLSFHTMIYDFYTPPPKQQASPYCINSCLLLPISAQGLVTNFLSY